MDFYYLGYYIRFNIVTGLYSGVLIKYGSDRVKIETIKPTANHYYTDKTKAENYIVQRLRHHREDRPCKFIGRINYCTRHLYKDAEILYTIPKCKEHKEKRYDTIN